MHINKKGGMHIMSNKKGAILTILVLSIALTANAACESVERDLPDTPVGHDDEITIWLTQDGFLGNVVKVTEYLPEGFGYVTGSFTGSHTPTYHTSNNTLVMYLAGSDEITATYNTTTGTVTQIDSAMFFGAYDGFVGMTPASGAVTGDATLISDTTPPTINSVTLDPTVVAVGDPILVTVDATDDVGIASVTADGVGLTKSDDVWTGTIIAEEGTHFVCVSATDTSDNVGWNNSTSYTTTIVDTTDPVVNSVILNRTDVTDGDPIRVTVDATDDTGVVSVTAEGVALTPLGGNIWDGIIIAATGNDVVVNVCAMDGADNAGWNNSTSYTARWIREDVYPDGTITITDIVRVGNHMGETGEPGWIPEDVYPDGTITITDIVRVGNHMGETRP